MVLISYILRGSAPEGARLVSIGLVVFKMCLQSFDLVIREKPFNSFLCSLASLKRFQAFSNRSAPPSIYPNSVKKSASSVQLSTQEASDKIQYKQSSFVGSWVAGVTLIIKSITAVVFRVDNAALIENVGRCKKVLLFACLFKCEF